MACRSPEIQPAEPHQARANGVDHSHPPKHEPAPPANKADSAALQDAALAKEALSQELSLLQTQLSAANAARASAEAEVQELTEALAQERDARLRSEVEVSELRAKLQQMDELEQELQKHKVAAAEQAGRKGGGGLWGYISGA